MPQAKKKREPATSPPMPLPKSREALGVLLRAVEKVLDFLEPTHQAQVLRLAELRKTLQDPLRISKQQALLKAAAEASTKRFAQGGPSASVLAPYIDPGKMHRLLESRAAARKELVPPPVRQPGGLRAWRPAARAFQAMLDSEREILDLFRALQHRVIAALEACGPDRVNASADTSADRKCPRTIRLPENPDVTRLAKKILEESGRELSQNDIAVQFTEGDEKRAKSLLRQLRRYPDLLGKTER